MTQIPRINAQSLAAELEMAMRQIIRQIHIKASADMAEFLTNVGQAKKLEQ